MMRLMLLEDQGLKINYKAQVFIKIPILKADSQIRSNNKAANNDNFIYFNFNIICFNYENDAFFYVGSSSLSFS